MALFTDAPISTLDQLAAQDSAVLDVASTEGIDAAAKIVLAQDELGVELMAALARAPFSLASPSAWWPGSIYQSTLGLSNIAVTPPLRLWHTFRTLALIYRDAYGAQLNDRYLGKWNAYSDLSKWASEMLWQTGVGVVSDPVVIAEIPKVGVLNGTLSAATYFIQMAWLNARGEEGMASAVTSVSAPDQNSVQVQANSPPKNAAAWNIYAGTSIDSIMLQNPFPIDPGQTWALSAAGLTAGRSAGTGQAPNYFRQLPRYLQRG
ncbi:MAG TPA: hypothetical protein VEU11_06090 [Terriglobales bacterium]|nr:hypothetical protein [Terriglobales bacterium]